MPKTKGKNKKIKRKIQRGGVNEINQPLSNENVRPSTQSTKSNMKEKLKNFSYKTGGRLKDIKSKLGIQGILVCGLFFLAIITSGFTGKNEEHVLSYYFLLAVPIITAIKFVTDGKSNNNEEKAKVQIFKCIPFLANLGSLIYIIITLKNKNYINALPNDINYIIEGHTIYKWVLFVFSLAQVILSYFFYLGGNIFSLSNNETYFASIFLLILQIIITTLIYKKINYHSTDDELKI